MQLRSRFSLRTLRLVSDIQKPNPIQGLIDATMVARELLCGECAYFRREDAKQNDEC